VRLSARDQVAQLTKVLRAKLGDKIICLDGTGAAFECAIESISAKQVDATILAECKLESDPLVKVCLALPLLKGGRFEWALEKACEIGVASVIPVNFEHSVVRVEDGSDGKAESKVNRWQTILREASEQCERATIPQIVSPTSFNQLLKNSPADATIVCAERQKVPRLLDVIHGWKMASVVPMYILLVVGPEGGLSQSEMSAASEAKADLVSLGPRILRSETAAIFALSQIISAIGDHH
jgi:16S rRNA (uracil1498-N3)-methyltransferase